MFFFLGVGRVIEIVDARAGRPCWDGSDAEIGGCHHPNSRRTRSFGSFLRYARKEAAIWLSLAAFQNWNEPTCILSKQLQTGIEAQAVGDTILLKT